jgi:hypothetical protein
MGMRRLRKVNRRAQEQEAPNDKPDIKRPPDSDIPEFDERRPTRPESPPFTGEDVEDVPRPEPNEDLPVM